MALPVMNTPTYTLQLPSTGNVVKYRPFLVKEEKILLIALQDASTEAIISAIKQIIINCTFGEVNVNTLTSFDLEYIFLQLRMKSKGTDVDLTFQCQNIVDGVTCGTTNNVKLDLNTVKTEKDPNHTNKIFLTDTLLVTMKYPTVDILSSVQKNIEDDSITAMYDSLFDFVDTISEGEEIFTFDKEGLTVFIDSLTSDQFAKIRNFFDTLPKLQAELDITCKKCKHHDTIKLEGLQSFLD